MKKSTITIGIPAHNESANIIHLIEKIKRQELTCAVIDNIIVYNDASKDETAKKLQKLRNKKLIILTSTTRKGLANAQNIIFANSSSDIVVLLNADVHIHGKHFLAKLISPILKDNADLTSASVAECKPQTFFESILYISMTVKNNVFTQYKNGNNLYTCHGTARAFSRRLYRTLRFPYSIGEDAFSYFFCLSHGFTFTAVRSAYISYKLPTHFHDHELQSLRYIESQEHMRASFNPTFVENEYKIPFSLIFKVGVRYVFRFPHLAFLYLLSYSVIKIKSHFVKKIVDIWEISASSKELHLSL